MTRGNSKLGSSKRTERDALVQSWEARADLATIGYYMESQGQRVKHLSDILHFCVETARALVLKTNSPFLDTASASQYLSDRTGVNLNPGDKGKKNLVSNLLLESSTITADDLPIPEIPRPQVNEELIASLKAKAKEQFLSQGESLFTDRAEKDSKIAQEAADVFATIKNYS